MEKATVTALLEKYWQAETTIAEEQALAAYFRGDQVDPELQTYSDMFSFFHEETQVSAGPDFGNRILQRLGLPLGEEPAQGASGGWGHENGQAPVTPVIPVIQVTAVTPVIPVTPVAPVTPITRKPFRLGVVGAAAAILLIVAGLFLLKPPGQPTILADNRSAAGKQDTQAATRIQGRYAAHAMASARIVDTYDDPEQALAAVRHALLVASRNLNQGRREITGASK